MTSRQTSSRQTSSRQTSSRQTKSASYEVGYGKPPRHTQFQKGKSGNPGGRRPQQNWPIEPVERLKELTLREAYRGIVIKKEEGGVGMPAFAIQAILRSQMELAMSGNARAQRDILKAVQSFERENAQALAATLSREEVETTKQQLEDIRATWLVMREIEEAHADEEERFGAWAKHMMRRARQDYTDEDEEEKEQTPERQATIGGTGVPAKEADTEEGDMKRPAAAPAPLADRAPQPVPPACDPLVDDEPAAGEPPVSTKFRPRKGWTPGPDRYARHPLRERIGFRHRRRTGDQASPPGVTWNEAVSRHSQRQKSKNSLLNSLLSGNPIPVRSRSFMSARRMA